MTNNQQAEMQIELLLAENKTLALILNNREESIKALLDLNEKLRDVISSNPNTEHQVYQSIIKDFIQKNIRLNPDMSCSVEIDGNKFSCTIIEKKINSTNLFNLIFNHYKNKSSIWNY